MQFRVGQVLYVVLKKENRVVPMQVTEEITKKTLSGVETTYRVIAGTDQANSLMIDQIAGEIFDSPESCHKALSERATRSIQKLVVAARAKASEWYGTQEQHVLDDDASAPNIATIAREPPTQDELTDVQMPDGSIVKARIKIPEGLT